MRTSDVPNIDPIYFLTPLVVIGFSVGLLVYWRLRRRLSGSAVALSLAAYGGAIAAKVALQAFTLGPLTSASGGNPWVLGVYYGGQTALFEVGGAFLVAGWAVAHRELWGVDAEGFGLSLAFWENAVLIATPLLLGYLVDWSVLSHPGTASAHQLYTSLQQTAPALFLPPAAALPLIAPALLERVSSLFAHFAWGYLAVMAAVFRRPRYIVLAAPIGFLGDFLVPFVGVLGIDGFELVVFAISAVGLGLALWVTREFRRFLVPPSPSPGSPSTGSTG